MKDAILKIKGIKCDYFDYRDMTVTFEDYPEWLNKPCPECGENLLTKDDLITVMALELAVDHINSKRKSIWTRISHFLFGSKYKHFDIDTHNGIKITEKQI